MYLAKVSQWMLCRALLSPIGWLWMAASLCALPALRVLTPQGVLGHKEDQAALFYQVAFLAALAGAMFSLAALGENDWLLRRCGTFRKLSSQWTGVTVCAFSGSGLVALGSLWGNSESPVDSAALLATGLSSLHLAALGGLLLQLPGRVVSHALALPLFAWVLPSFLPSQGVPMGHLVALMSAHRDPILLRDPSPAVFLTATGPIIALGIGVFILSSGRAQAPAPSR